VNVRRPSTNHGAPKYSIDENDPIETEGGGPYGRGKERIEYNSMHKDKRSRRNRQHHPHLLPMKIAIVNTYQNGSLQSGNKSAYGSDYVNGIVTSHAIPTQHLRHQSHSQGPHPNRINLSPIINDLASETG